MNKHFEDSLYYLRRAAEHAKIGLDETLEPQTARVRGLVGRDEESEPEPTRLESVRDDLEHLERTAERRARGVVGRARATLPVSRSLEGSDER